MDCAGCAAERRGEAASEGRFSRSRAAAHRDQSWGVRRQIALGVLEIAERLVISGPWSIFGPLECDHAADGRPQRQKQRHRAKSVEIDIPAAKREIAVEQQIGRAAIASYI